MHKSDQTKRMKRIMEELARMGSADLEGIRQEMQDRGEDPEVIREQGMAFIRGLKGHLRLAAAGVERQDTISKLEALRDEARRRLSETGKNVQTLIRQLSNRSGAELSISFRKIESLDDNEALDLLTDVQLLALLREMNEENE